MKRARFAISLAVATLVTAVSCAPATAPNETADTTSGSAPAADGFKQIGYLPSWAGSVSSVQYQYLTHINYAFALPNPGGTLQPIENASKLASLVPTAHANGVRVLLSIGGWNDGNDSAFEALAASSGSRSVFVQDCLAVADRYGLDGIDIDWEYPDPGASGARYQELMSELCSALHARGKLCTAAVVAQGTTAGGVPSAVFGDVDYLQIMAYDANNADHSSYAYAESSLKYWRDRGLPAAKAVLGVPFYARPSWAAYSTLLAAGCVETANSCHYQGAINWYNGTTLIGQKRQLALANGGGLMNWELSQDVSDARSLLRVMSGGVALR
jgi:chitinase